MTIRIDLAADTEGLKFLYLHVAHGFTVACARSL